MWVPPESSCFLRWTVDITSGQRHLSANPQFSQIAERIRNRVDAYQNPFPSLLEIPSKDHPYDPEKDSVLRRVRRLFGE